MKAPRDDVVEQGELRLPAHEPVADGTPVVLRRVEVAVLFEHPTLHLLQLAPWFDPELLHEQSPRLPVDLERLRLAARAVQREHELPAQPFAQRRLRHESLEVPDDLRVAAEGELRVGEVLLRAEPQLLQPSDVGLAGVVVVQVGQRGAAPQREPLVQRPRRRIRIAPRERPPPSSTLRSKRAASS